MKLKFKDLSKINKWFYVSFGIAALAGLLYLIIDFNIWVLFLSILFLLKMLDVKSEQKAMNLLDDYAEICTKQSDVITDLSFKLDKSEQKIKELESKKRTEKKVAEKKTTTKKTATKKTTTAKKPVKKGAKKDD